MKPETVEVKKEEEEESKVDRTWIDSDNDNDGLEMPKFELPKKSKLLE